MPDGTGMDVVAKAFPERVFDVGIAEGHAVTFAAGIATQGIVPVCAIYSSFLQRAFDMIVHDCAIQHLHVVFALDRSGVVGADGPTHHGVLDIGYLRIIQGMVVMAPKDEQELRDMLYSAIHDYTKGPVSIRYPRGNARGVQMGAMKSLPLGKAETLRAGKHIAIMGFGTVTGAALEAAEILASQGIEAEVINARFAKPLDEECILDCAQRFDHILTVEDGQKQGGFGSAVAEFLAQHTEFATTLTIHGIDDVFVEHGTQEELWRDLRLDAAGIAGVAQEILQSTKA
jgi:1-deoxy-D-xylulose-5-phosphate synthase